MSDRKSPELHVYEEVRNDSFDVAAGFGVFFVVLLVVAVIMGIIAAYVK
ncbi:YqzM family protein [Paenibacillus thalictri]|uniref:YqzM family protein n=1 Tax=Paenibacillus thalictri TaxID=2527873 RepID=A0A4Q9DGP6_9BACL|nr:YqzM family protein [Paenibacillus thalictri]TBL71507.1 YqzM family protein [Paenibacillus thalictri]